MTVTACHAADDGERSVSGVYVAWRALKFNMPGRWELIVAIQANGTDDFAYFNKWLNCPRPSIACLALIFSGARLHLRNRPSTREVKIIARCD